MKWLCDCSEILIWKPILCYFINYIHKVMHGRCSIENWKAIIICLHFNNTNNRDLFSILCSFFAGVDEEICYGGAVQVKVQQFLQLMHFIDVQQHESYFEELHASWAPYINLLKQFQNNLPFTNTLRILEVKSLLIWWLL